MEKNVNSFLRELVDLHINMCKSRMNKRKRMDAEKEGSFLNKNA